MVYPYLYGTLISENGFLAGRGVDSDEDRRSGARLHRAGWLDDLLTLMILLTLR